MEEEAAVSKTCAVPESIYAPNFRKVEGAYCFLLVRPSVRPYVRPFVRPSVTKFMKIHVQFEI